METNVVKGRGFEGGEADWSTGAQESHMKIPSVSDGIRVLR